MKFYIKHEDWELSYETQPMGSDRFSTICILIGVLAVLGFFVAMAYILR